MFFVLIGSSR